jgi:hypothetical protein
MSDAHEDGLVASLYEELARDSRRPYLDRAQDNAKLTIPDLYPPDGHRPGDTLPDPAQSVGGKGVDNLASKLTQSLLPIGVSFFKYSTSEEAVINTLKAEVEKAQVDEDENLSETQLAEIGEQAASILKELDTSLTRVVDGIIAEGEAAAVRVALGEATKQLLIGGNVLLDLPPTGSCRYVSLHNYVVKRDGYGDVIQIIIREELDPETVEDSTLRDKLLELQKVDPTNEESTPASGTPEEGLVVYRHYKRSNQAWDYSLEAGGQEVDNGVYKLDRLPVIPLRLYKRDGEDYGPAFVTNLRGDLQHLEASSKALKVSFLAMTRIVSLVHPNSSTDIQELNDAENLAFVQGSSDDIDVFSLAGALPDLQYAYQGAADTKKELNESFLVNSAFTRTGERVTAEEQRFRAQQLDDALGGIFSVLALDLQPPLVNALTGRLEEAKRMPKLPDEIVSVSIVAGLEALGRNHEVEKMRSFALIIGELLGPGALTTYAKPRSIIMRVANSMGLPIEDDLKTVEEITTEAQQQQQQALIEKLGPTAITEGSHYIQNQVNNNT